MRIINSLKQRKRNYYIKHFEKTKYGKNIKKLKNKYKGNRCFIVGNGPSLNVNDLEKIKDEYTFAFNRIFYIFDQTEWRPTFYCAQDDRMVKNSIDSIKKEIKTPYIFVPINFNWYYDMKFDTEFYFAQEQQISEEKMPLFSENLEHRVIVGNTVAYTAMQFAAYLGFEEIYLIGIDHQFQIQRDRDGNIQNNPEVKDYFCSEYNADKEELYIPKLDVSTLAYISANEYTKRHNVKIYNATRGGKLEVFPRVEFDKLF